MALDINGYNAVFRKFADFAQAEVNAGRHKAIADAGMKGLKGRSILAVSAAKNDAVHKWTRTNVQYIVNDRTRNLFRKAVFDMFGGESKVPESVRKAMLLDDYDAGKPLTARRIMAVKNAIDECGIPRRRAEAKRLASFDDPANKAAMLAKGYSKAELPRLARAAHFYAELNMASRRCPGGGVLNGARAQEETLFRRSNLCVSLYQFDEYHAKLLGITLGKGRYPMEYGTAGIYSGRVMFFRKCVQEDYALMDEPFKCAVASAAAISHPDLTPDGRLADWAARATADKIRKVLRIGLLHGHDSIVLGAWGCGAFRNPSAKQEHRRGRQTYSLV